MEASKNSAVTLHKCTDGNQKQTWHYDNIVCLSSEALLATRRMPCLSLGETNEARPIWSVYDSRSEQGHGKSSSR